jgi:hypothetical protein
MSDTAVPLLSARLAKALEEAALAAAGPGLLEQRVHLDLTAPRVEVKFLPTPTLGERLFYRGNMFILSGHKKAGKTLGMMSVALDQIEAGGVVVYLDFENGGDLIGDRLRDMGADAQAIADRFYYVPFPKGLTLDNFLAQLQRIAAELPGAFVIFDSLRGLFTRLSATAKTAMSVNDPTSIEQVLGPVSEVVKTTDLTAGVIDHANKKQTGDEEYVTAGSVGKEQVADVVMFWSKVEPFSEDEEGVVSLKAASDRRGKLPLAPLFFRVGGQGEGNQLTFERVDASQVGPRGQVRDAVEQFLLDMAPEAFTQTSLERDVDGKATSIREAVRALATDPESPVQEVPGERAGRVKYAYLTKPEPPI